MRVNLSEFSLIGGGCRVGSTTFTYACTGCERAKSVHFWHLDNIHSSGVVKHLEGLITFQDIRMIIRDPCCKFIEDLRSSFKFSWHVQYRVLFLANISFLEISE